MIRSLLGVRVPLYEQSPSVDLIVLVIIEQSDELAHPGAAVGPATDLDERPVYNDLAVDELGAGGPKVGFQIRVAGHRLSNSTARRNHKEWTVAVGRDRFPGIEVVPDDRDRLRAIAEILGSPAAR